MRETSQPAPRAAEWIEGDDLRSHLDQPWAEIEAYQVASELIEVLSQSNGWVGEGGLRKFRRAYGHFDDSATRLFRALVTAYLARLFAAQGRRAFPLAAAIVDAWFPPRDLADRDENAG